MIRSILGTLFRRLPPVARRDQRISDLRRRVSRLRAANRALTAGPDATPGVTQSDRAPVDAVNHPSFQARIHAERRLSALNREAGAKSSVIGRGKFWVYDLARSHGIEVPHQYGRWNRPADIPWDDLPDRVVIKTAFATSARGVLPLRRRPAGWELITQNVTKTSAEWTEDLTRRLEERQVTGPFGAEELLDGGDDELPIDIRTYAFYGNVPFALLRRPVTHGDLDTARFLPVDPHGASLVDVEKYPALSDPNRESLPRELAIIDLTIPVPKNFPDVIDAATRLSTAIRLPFARIDLYGLDDRVVFGEVTPRPGGRQWLGPELDIMLGDAWERAQAKLSRDLADGVPPEPEWGPHHPPENAR